MHTYTSDSVSALVGCWGNKVPGLGTGLAPGLGELGGSPSGTTSSFDTLLSVHMDSDGLSDLFFFFWLPALSSSTSSGDTFSSLIFLFVFWDKSWFGFC